MGAPPLHFAPLSELFDEDAADNSKSGPVFHAHQSPPDIRLRQKRDKVAALDMRFQDYRKAEP